MPVPCSSSTFTAKRRSSDSRSVGRRRLGTASNTRQPSAAASSDQARTRHSRRLWQRRPRAAYLEEYPQASGRLGPHEGVSAVRRYLILIEPTATGFSAYSPDFPGCAATGETRDDVERNMRDAVELHVEGLRELGEPVPPPSISAAYVEVAA